jgi:hypothetical protein
MSRIFKIVFPLALAAGFLAYLVWSSLSLGGVSCAACVQFAGQSACRTASGTTEREATSTATDNACEFVTSGRDELIPCTQAPPISVQCVNS